jgi:hypothetical protein
MKQFIKNIIRWFANAKFLSSLRIILWPIIFQGLQSKQAEVVFYNDPERGKIIDLIKKIKQETKMLLRNYEAYQIYTAVKRTEKVQGDIAEVGVFKGGSAKLICEAKGEKPLHLFDTFEGIPRVEEIDAAEFYKGKYAASFEEVKKYLSEYKNVYFYKGIFPDTAEHIKNRVFSFVSLDVDTYESTLSCLEFFYPRMSRGGIILSHDYLSASGVTKAVDEFFKYRPEPIIELPGAQCLMLKT